MAKAFRLLSLCACATVVASVASTYAQDEGQPVSFSVGLRAEYTDNRDLSEQDEESNLDIILTPQVKLGMDTEQSMIKLFYAPSFRYRSDPSPVQDENEVFHAVGASVDVNASDRTQLRLREKFEAREDASVTADGSQVREDRLYNQNTVLAGVNHAFSRYMNGDLSVEHFMKAYDDAELAAGADRDHLKVDAVVWRQVSRNLGVQGRVGWTAYSFDNDDGLDRDFDKYTLAVGLLNVFSPELRGTLSAGADLAEYSDGSLDGQTTPYAAADLTFSPTPATRLTGEVSHGLRQADVYGFASQEYTEFRGRFETDATAALTLGATVLVRESTYDEDSLPAGTGVTSIDADETTTLVSGDATWKVNEASRVTFRQSYEDVDSDVEESYSKNTSSLAYVMDI